MGNGQSAQAPRRSSNRLSKPRTNAAANLSSLKPGVQGHPGSQSNAIWHSFVSEGGAEDRAARSESRGWKQPRILRSKSTPPKELKLDTDSEIDTEYSETLSRRPSSSSRALEVGEDIPGSPQSYGLTRR